jgi:hypothetical protein
MISQLIFISAWGVNASSVTDLTELETRAAALQTLDDPNIPDAVYAQQFADVEKSMETYFENESRRLDDDEKTPIEKLLALFSLVWGERMDWFMVCSFDMLNPANTMLNAAYPSADSHYFISIVPPGKQRKFSGDWANAEKYGITITSIAAYYANGDILFNDKNVAQYVDNVGDYGEDQFKTKKGIENMTIPLNDTAEDLDHNGYWVFIRVYRSEVTDDNTWQEFLNEGLLPRAEERDSVDGAYASVPTALEASSFCQKISYGSWTIQEAFANPLCALNLSGNVFEIIYYKMVESGNFETPRPSADDYNKQFSVPTTNGGLWANPTSEYMTVCPEEGNDIVRITGYWPLIGELPNTIYMDFMAVDLKRTRTENAAPYFDKRFNDPSLTTLEASLWDTSADLHIGTAYELYVTSSNVSEQDILKATGLTALKGPQIKWDADTGSTDRCVAIRIIDTDPSKSLATVDKSGSRDERMADCKALLGKVYPTARFCSSTDNGTCLMSRRVSDVLV